MMGQPESWTHRKLTPDWEWALIGTQLGATQTDLLKWLAWSKTEAASKGGKPPEPLPRPWDKTQEGAGDQALFLPIDELEARLNAPRE